MLVERGLPSKRSSQFWGRRARSGSWENWLYSAPIHLKLLGKFSGSAVRLLPNTIKNDREAGNVSGSCVNWLLVTLSFNSDIGNVSGNVRSWLRSAYSAVKVFGSVGSSVNSQSAMLRYFRFEGQLFGNCNDGLSLTSNVSRLSGRFSGSRSSLFEITYRDNRCSGNVSGNVRSWLQIAINLCRLFGKVGNSVMLLFDISSSLQGGRVSGNDVKSRLCRLSLSALFSKHSFILATAWPRCSLAPGIASLSHFSHIAW